MLQGFDSPRRAPNRPGGNGQALTDGQRGSPNGRAAGTSSRNARPTAPLRPGNGNKQIPYLNVITNFSKPNPSPTFPPSTQRGHERSESLQERRRNGRLNGGSRSRLEALRAGEPVSGLSPSDRELMIGWSIPGPPNSIPRTGTKRSLKRLQQARQPSIAISLAATSSLSSKRGRTTSSIYSRLPTGNTHPTSVPPVPAPVPVSRYSLVTSIETSSRCTSWATDFSEDDTLQHSRPESRDRLSKRDSNDSLAAKYRSKGWWTQVLSPFEERFELPRDIHLDQVESGSPRADNSKKDHEATAVAVNDLDDTSVSSRRVTTSDDPDLQSFSWRWNLLKRIGMDEDSPEIFGKHGMGLAVEYFEACWHDQNRPTPYFTCENHTCSYGKGNFQGKEAVANMAELPNGEEPELNASRGLDEPLPKDDAFQQTPQNRFSKDFGAKVGATRPKSNATVFEEDLIDTPTIQDARAAPVVQVAPPSEPAIRAALRERHQAEERAPPSPPAMTPSLRTEFVEQRALQMEPPKPAAATARPQFPPRSDSMDRVTPTPTPAPVPMPMPLPPSAFSPPTPSDYARGASMQSRSTPQEPTVRRPSPAQTRSFGPEGERGGMREINDSHPTTYFPPPPRNPRLVDDPRTRYIPPAREESRTREEQYSATEQKPKKAGFFKRNFGKRKNMTKKEKKKRRCIFCWIFLGLLLLVIGIVVAVVLVTLPRADMPVQTAWLNVSGYPPVPTGISTIVRPNVNTSDGCISPPTMWSCALPKEIQPSIAPNPPDRPNFRIEIRFQNGTALTNNATFSKRSVDHGNMSLRQYVHTQLLRVRDSFTNNLFSPSPPPPSEEDQEFLGNTTDQIRAPLAGEPTPFFMSFVDAGLVGTPLYKRQTNSAPDNSTNATDPFPDLTNDIPPPSINQDGTAASANLYPFPTAQPLKLYNRGRQDEHYGFYTYFDRNIFLKSASVDNITEIGVVPDDENGGATESEASLRCTWAQTRFLVQIWTNTGGSLSLLGANSTGSNSGSSTSTGSASAAQSTNSATGSSANNFTMPGSFPYPVSITLDRHGGDIESKSVYCYGMDDREHIIKSERKFQLEDRSFGGTIINPALGLFAHINVSKESGGPGGIDGGTGGCSCLWRNFEFGN